MPNLAVAIVVAAGAGVRMGGGSPKALLPVSGRPMLTWSLDALARSDRIGAIVVVAPPASVAETARIVAEYAPEAVVTPGGASRSESVRAGLAAAPGDPDRVLVHDAARPLLTPDLVAAVLDGVEGADGAIAAQPVADTLKRAGAGMLIAATVDREGLWGAQTPQAFRAPALREAVEAAARAGTLASCTDCASIVEAAGGRIRLVSTGAPNVKVTTPADLRVAEALLAAAV